MTRCYNKGVHIETHTYKDHAFAPTHSDTIVRPDKDLFVLLEDAICNQGYFDLNKYRADTELCAQDETFSAKWTNYNDINKTKRQVIPCYEL